MKHKEPFADANGSLVYLMSGVEEGGGEPSSGSTPDKKSSGGVSRAGALMAHVKAKIALLERSPSYVTTTEKQAQK